MSWSNEELDELFRKEARKQEVPYSDRFWEEFEATHLAVSTGQRRLPWWWLTIPVAGLVALFIGASQLMGDAQTSYAVAAKGTTQLPKGVQHNEEKKGITTQASVSAPQRRSVLTQLPTVLPIIEPATSTHEFSISSDMAQVVEPIEDIESHPGDDLQVQQGTDLLAPESNEHSEMSLTQAPFGRKRLPWTLTAAVGLSQEPTKVQGVRFAPSYSFGISRHIRLAQGELLVGVQGSVQNFQSTGLSRSAKRYHFGSTTYVQEADLQHLVLLEVPLAYRYHLEQHHVGMQVTPMIPLVAHYALTSYENGSAVATEQGFYGTGVQTFGLRLGLNYAIDLSPSWQAGVDLSTILMNPVDQSMFSGTPSRMPVQVAVGIRKFFLK